MKNAQDPENGDDQPSVVLVMSTFPDSDTARQIGTSLIETQLAACVNLSREVESIYTWQGEVQREKEVMAWFKTTRAKVADLQAALIEAHPYEVPEVLVLPVIGGAKNYLEWVESSVARDEDAT